MNRRVPVFRRGVATVLRAAALLACGAAGFAGRAFAAAPSAAPWNAASGSFASPLAAARAVVEACAAAANGCNGGALPADAQVRGADGRSFRASWLWLREAVGEAKARPSTARLEAMRQAREHLDEWETEANSPVARPGAGQFEPGRSAAAKILAEGQFQLDAGPTWLDRQVARLQDWFLRLLLGMDRVGTHNPWIAPLVEWTCFLLAAGGLLFFARRSLARQGLRIALGEGAAGAKFSGRETTDWAQLATRHGAAGEWREGVHCLYRAALLSLESRRAWRANPTRTPREYIRLLSPGSQAQGALWALTGIFEQVWYGHRPASELIFRAAQGEFEAIRVADVQRDVADGRRHSAEFRAEGTA